LALLHHAMIILLHRAMDLLRINHGALLLHNHGALLPHLHGVLPRTELPHGHWGQLTPMKSGKTFTNYF
jgi:hypothetical protein